MSLFSTQEIAFGLDISDRNLRLIQLREKQKTPFVQLYNEVKLPTDCISQGEILKPEVFLASLKKLIKTKHGYGQLSSEVVSVLPEPKTFLKVLDIPLVEPAEIEKEIKTILPQHLPLAIDEIFLDWQIIKTNQKDQTVLVGASPKKIVNSYVEILTQANLMPTVLEVEAAAISRVIIDEKQKNKAQIIVDFGASRTGIFLYDENIVKFTISSSVSGNAITEAVSKAMKIDSAKAEKAKIACGFDKTKCQGALLDIFSDTVNKLSQSIKKAADFYQQNTKVDKKIDRVVLCGGGANFLNITRVLQQKINIHTVVADPWKKINNPYQKSFSRGKSRSYITALGLAMRGLKSDTFL